MQQSPWTILQIAPDVDELTIRRAYTRLLKQTHPEDNPAGFQELRAAYEAALAQTARRVEKVVLRETDESEDDSTVVQAETKHEKAESAHSAHYLALQDAMKAALERGDRLGILAILRKSQHGLDLSLMEQHALTHQVMLFLVRDSSITASELEAIIKEFGWKALASAQDDSLPALLLHRLEGLKWYEKTILAPTKGWFRYFFGLHFVTGWAETQLLMGRRGIAAILYSNIKNLRSLLSMWNFFCPVIGDKLKFEDIEYCKKFVKSPPMIRYVYFVVLALVACIIFFHTYKKLSGTGIGVITPPILGLMFCHFGFSILFVLVDFVSKPFFCRKYRVWG